MSKRESKVRNVFGTPAKSQEIYNGVNFLPPSADSNPLRATKSSFAFPTTSRGTVAVVKLSSVGALAEDTPVLEQEQAISDLDFNPFDDNVIATSGESTVSVWRLGERGPVVDQTPEVTIENAHDKRMISIVWHPLASNVLLTTSVDKTIKFWDIGQGGSERLRLDESIHKDHVTSISWNYEGTVMATSSRDKKLRIIDPRSGNLSGETIAHEGAKSFRAQWLGSSQQILTVGFKKQPDREIGLFDVRNLSSRLYSHNLDSIPSSMFPVYDPDLSLVYVIGKGDGNIRIFEHVPGDAKPLQESGEFRSSTAQAGFAMLPKRSCDVMKCEISRILKLQGTSVVPIRFEITRQNAGYIFQRDLYPDSFDNNPVYSADSWFGGETGAPILTPIQPPAA